MTYPSQFPAQPRWITVCDTIGLVLLVASLGWALATFVLALCGVMSSDWGWISVPTLLIGCGMMSVAS